MELRHYSNWAVKLDRARTYTQRVGDKPSGLWVSVPGDDDWPAWCCENDIGVALLAAEHAVTLTPEARILHVTTLPALKALTVDVPWTGFRGSTWIDHHVDWPDLASRYDGILISPYQWKAVLDTECFWYRGWDCASGCIWNLSAIAKITRLAPDPLGRVRSRTGRPASSDL